MRRFEATLRRRVFWFAVVVPPVVFWCLVQALAYRAGEGPMKLWEVYVLIGLAQALPLAALAWILGSVCAYTITPGKLIVHRVVSDREFALETPAEATRLRDGAIAVRLPRRTLHLRVAEPETCLALLRAAATTKLAGASGAP